MIQHCPDTSISTAHPPRQGIVYAICGPSGGGKTNLIHGNPAIGVQGLLQLDRSFMFSVSATTRAKRSSEEDGKDYHFIGIEQFEQQRNAGHFIEWEDVYKNGNFYGTPRAPLEQALASGHDVLVDCDYAGLQTLRRELPGHVVGIFLKPKSLESLQNRLQVRHMEGKQEFRYDDMVLRLDKAKSELEKFERGEYRYDYVVHSAEKREDTIAAAWKVIGDVRQQQSQSTPHFKLIGGSAQRLSAPLVQPAFMQSLAHHHARR